MKLFLEAELENASFHPTGADRVAATVKALARLTEGIRYSWDGITTSTWKIRDEDGNKIGEAYFKHVSQEDEPVLYARDLDGTGSLHPCAKGDPGAIPLYRRP